MIKFWTEPQFTAKNPILSTQILSLELKSKCTLQAKILLLFCSMKNQIQCPSNSALPLSSFQNRPILYESMRYFDTRGWKGSAITCGKDQTTPCPMGGSLCPSPWNLSLTVSCNLICYATKVTMRTLVTKLSLFTYHILAAPTHLSPHFMLGVVLQPV